MNISQVMALLIFVVMFILIITEVVERYQATLLAAFATIIVVFLLCMHSTKIVWDVISIRDLVHGEFWYAPGHGTAENGGINWATIIFLAGMMVMVEAMARSGFFRFICLALAKLVHYKPTRLLVIFMLMSAVLSMFIDSICLWTNSGSVNQAAICSLSFPALMQPIPQTICPRWIRFSEWIRFR